jgi:transcriptional regulator with XRE-family HTH domain
LPWVELKFFSPMAKPVHPLQQQFATVLRRKREEASLSQEALAARANLHRNYVGLLERAQRMPSILVVQQLATALNTTMSALLAEVEQEEA